MAHTPTPWQFEKNMNFGSKGWPFGYISQAPTPMPVFQLDVILGTSEQAHENAAFIVRAVNAFEANEALIKELVEALKDARASIARSCYGGSSYEIGPIDDVLATAERRS